MFKSSKLSGFMNEWQWRLKSCPTQIHKMKSHESVCFSQRKCHKWDLWGLEITDDGLSILGWCKKHLIFLITIFKSWGLAKIRLKRVIYCKVFLFICVGRIKYGTGRHSGVGTQARGCSENSLSDKKDISIVSLIIIFLNQEISCKWSILRLPHSL